MKIESVSTISMESINILLYGPPGSGKTTQASQFPSPLFLDFDKGLLGIRSSNSRHIPYHKMDPYSAWEELKRDIPLLHADLESKTIVLDSLTAAGEAAMLYAQKLNNRIGKQPSFEDWDSYGNEVRSVIKDLRKIPKNLIVIAHEKLEQDKLLGAIYGLPLLPGKLAHRIFQLFDEVYHTQSLKDTKGGVSYVMNCKKDVFFDAKSRILKNEILSVSSYSDMMANLKQPLVAIPVPILAQPPSPVQQVVATADNIVSASAESIMK